jgi:hypothetical protein
MSGNVYVCLGHSDFVLSARQRTIEALNATVVLDFGPDDELIGVEVLDAVRVAWNGKTMPLPGGEECSTTETDSSPS